jgi:hypothetical protein
MVDRAGEPDYKPALPSRLAAGSAQVAQLVEHATENRSVGGSIPPLGTISIFSSIKSTFKLSSCAPLRFFVSEWVTWPVRAVRKRSQPRGADAPHACTGRFPPTCDGL